MKQPYLKVMKATEVFTPGTLPKYTYYERPNRNLEEALLHAVDTPGIIASVSGPSKSGKTVLCESVIGLGSMLLVTGGGVDSEPIFWQRIRSRLKLPAGTSTSTAAERSHEVGGAAKGGLGFLLKAEGEVSGKIARSTQDQTTLQFEGISGVDLLERVRAGGQTLVVDDFHYIGRDLQASLVEQFKEAARAGCTIVVVSVPHRSDDVIRANPDLRGRLRAVEVSYWTEEELSNIPKLGFPNLNVKLDEAIVKKFAVESLSSPQLMQSLCLDLCRAKAIDETLTSLTVVDVREDDLAHVLKGVASASSCQTALDILEKGPRVRGTERKEYSLKDGSSGDVYAVVLKAISSGKPQLALSYPEIRDRVALIAEGEPPSGSSIVSTLTQMDEAARNMRQGDRVLEWDSEKETLNFPDPYFVYFLRWRVVEEVLISLTQSVAGGPGFCLCGTNKTVGVPASVGLRS